MKKKIALLLAVLMTVSLLLSGCGGTSSPDGSSGGMSSAAAGRPLMLWEVTSPENGDQHLYLMGTIHYGEADMYPMEAPIEEAFAVSDALAVEIDLLAFEEDTAYVRQLSDQFTYYSDGSAAKDHLSEETYTAAKTVLQENQLYQEWLERCKVSQWSSLLQGIATAKTGLQAAYGVDRYLLRRAKETDKVIYELESVEFQWKMMDDFSDDLQELILTGSLDIDGQAEATRQVFDAWKAGDSESMAAVDLSAATPEQKALLEEYYEAMLYDRNDAMTKKAEAYLQSGETVFFAVGGGHMGGSRGIVAQLREKGYNVRQIGADDTLSLPQAA